jgi:NitT/TauT family transport system substrate-binding protein
MTTVPITPFVRAGAAVVVVALLGAPLPLHAQPALETIELVQTTRSVQDWPLQVADRLGFFAANGVRVELSLAGASASVAQQLAAGSADIGSVSTTQVIEAIQGGAPLVQVLKNVFTSPYAVVARKGIGSIAQLRGKTIMIGGPSDITRVFMDKIMSANGLRPDEYTYTFAGAPAERYAALVSGGIDATLLLPPVTFRAISDGFPVLDQTQHYFPNFPTSGYTARIPWAKSHPKPLIAFSKSFLQGVRWLYDPANKSRALEILEEATNTKPDDALRTYEMYIPGRLFSTNGRYETKEFAAVVDALVQTKQIPPPAPAAAKFFDDTYVDAATAQLRGAR